MEYGILLVVLALVAVFAYTYYAYRTITDNSGEVIVWVDVPSISWGPALGQEWIEIVSQYEEED